MHIVMLGCYVDYLKDSEQADWLRRDLASVDRERTPWVIVGMHVSHWLPLAFPVEFFRCMEFCCLPLLQTCSQL